MSFTVKKMKNCDKLWPFYRDYRLPFPADELKELISREKKEAVE
jgi:hypothetical protein